MMNFKIVGTEFGEAIKNETTINQIRRVFSALTDLEPKNYSNNSITSKRSRLIYDWIMTIGDSFLAETDKTNLVRQAVISLVSDKDVQDKLLLYIPYIDVRPAIKTGARSYVHETRIAELKSLSTSDFDLTRLIKYCEELNTTFSYECYLSTAMLVRAIIDHIPPIFNKSTFAEVANNYGGKSFKDSMKNLDNSLRKISDSYLHLQIRKSEVLPNLNQVDFTNDLDVLLAEIYRALKQ